MKIGYLLENLNSNMYMKADGGNYCACVNAATLALIDAGIPLVDYVSACTASLVSPSFVKTCVATTLEIIMSFPVKRTFTKWVKT